MKKMRKRLQQRFPDIIYSRYIRKENDKYKSLIEQGMESDEVDFEYHSAIDLYYDEWAQIKSEKLLSKARMYDLELPVKFINKSLSCYYDESRSLGSVMNSKGRSFLRKQIDEYEQLHREKWGSIISIIFGLIGSVTGLIAIIKS